jgi:chromosomal replication initiator protein
MKPSVDQVKRATAEAFGLSLVAMLSASRRRRVARPRMVAMFLSRQMTGAASLPRIGQQFGKDHTTVLHAIQRVPQLMAEDPAFAAKVATARAAIEIAPSFGVVTGPLVTVIERDGTP